ncbi:MAG: hypothetical protein WDM90_10265 [Ferruginibacter sp.]
MANRLCTARKPKQLTAVIRIGADFISNYYQVRIPLSLTGLGAAGMDPNSRAYNDTLWVPSNSLDIDLQSLIKLKEKRNGTAGLNTKPDI